MKLNIYIKYFKSLFEVVYEREKDKLVLVFEFVDLDLKKHMSKTQMTPLTIQVFFFIIEFQSKFIHLKLFI